MSLFQDNSKEFDINNEKIQIIDNNPYYVLPENTKIYFGSKSEAFEYKPTFFGFDYKTAKKYGFVKTFTTNKELRLLALMELTPEHSFYQQASKDWKTKMTTIFGVGEEIKERNSVGTSDIEMMNYLCKKNMNGYAMNGKYRADKKFGNDFHAELVLCNPGKDADPIDAEDHKTVGSKSPPRLDRKRKPEPEPEPKEGENYPYFNMNFDNSSYDSPEKKPKYNHDTTQKYVYNTPGGKGKNKKTKRKLRKSKKSKRKQRKTRKK